MPHGEIRALIERADGIVKAAPARADRAVAYDRAEQLLREARSYLDAVADEATRLELAAQISRRLADLDQASWEPDAGLGRGVRRAPTAVDDPDRVPPGQHLTAGWPVLHVAGPPRFDPAAWRFTVTGLVEERQVLSWEAFRALPETTLTADLHCVTGWSRLDNTWSGVRFADVAAAAGVRSGATHALVYGHPAYSANLPLDVLLAPDVLFAWAHDGEPLAPEHGGPLRLVVPSRYAWKSVKWAFEVRLLPRDVRGYWEERGYHDDADPWREQRFHGD